MEILILSLVFMPFLAALLCFAVGKKSKPARDALVKAVVLAEFVLAIALLIQAGESETAAVVLPEICSMGLGLTAGGFRSIYVAIAAFMWLLTGFLSGEYFAHYRNRSRYYLFWLVTLGATVGIFLSNDLYTTFVFFEIMSFASYVWVAQDESEGALKAAETYLAVAVIGGMVLLMGLFLLYHHVGTLVISELPKACEGKKLYDAAICMLIGFGAKAGAFPIHIWLPKAHPVAPAPASALLSGMLTKTGIFGILVISCKMLVHDELWGAAILLIGVVTMFLGALLALFSINFKRTLACSSVSQIGFILVGIGMANLLGHHNALALRGAFLHMVNHSMFKLVLFMAAGVIYMNTHKLDLNDIRGFGRKKPVLKAVFAIGALGIGGIPLLSGYASKTLLHESIVEYIAGIRAGEFGFLFLTVEIMQLIEWVFLISGGFTVAYMLKLFFAVFVEKNNDALVQAKFDSKTRYMNGFSAAALILAAAVIPAMGIAPNLVMDKMADMAGEFLGAGHLEHAVHYFAWVNLKGGVISIAIGMAVYFGIIRRFMMKAQPDGSTEYVDRWPAFFDLEERFYRPVIEKLLPAVFGWVCSILDGLIDGITAVLISIGTFAAGVMDIFTDCVVVVLRNTVYRDSPRRGELDEGNAMTHVIGCLLNDVELLLNKTIWRNNEHKRDLEHWFVLKYVSFKENVTITTRSLSYGLIAFCLGLCATLIYLLIAAFI